MINGRSEQTLHPWFASSIMTEEAKWMKEGHANKTAAALIKDRDAGLSVARPMNKSI